MTTNIYLYLHRKRNRDEWIINFPEKQRKFFSLSSIPDLSRPLFLIYVSKNENQYYLNDRNEYK